MSPAKTRCSAVMVLIALASCDGESTDDGVQPEDTGPSGVTTIDSGEVEADAGADRFVVPGEPFELDAGPLAPDIEATWTLSDGQVLVGGKVQVTVGAPGHYSAVLELVGRGAHRSTDALALTAVYAQLTPAPTQASPMWTNDEFVVAVAWGLDRLVVVDKTSGAIVVSAATCTDPRSVAVVGPDAWVLCRDSDTLQRFTWSTGTLDATGALPWGSRGGAVVHDGTSLTVVAGGRGQGFTVDPSSLAVVERWPLVDDARAAATREGVVWAPRFRSSDASGVVVSVDRVGEPLGQVSVRQDPGPDSDTNARGVPTQLGAIAWRPDGRQLAIGGLKANIGRGVFRDGQALTFETTVRADVRLLDAEGAEQAAVLFDDRDRVSALAYAPRGEWLYVAHGGMEIIDVIDPFTAERAGVSTPLGGMVDALVVDDGSLWALSSLGRTLVRMDRSQPALPVETMRVDLTPTAGEPAEAAVLSGQRLFHRASDRRLNEGGYIACASCHPDGEHDGLTWDFTDRGEGLRNTLPLVGRSGTAHGPLHWSANFDEPQDFEHDIRGPQGGLGLMDDADFAETDTSLGAPKAGRSADLDALAAYMISLEAVPRSPHRNDDGSFTAAAERGRVLFEDAALQCVECHGGPEFTDSGFDADGAPRLHDVGTLTAASGQRLGGPLPGIDTPSLRGTWATGPWLHDGSATSILDVFDPSDLHGTTSSLSAAQLADLEAYLLQLE